MSTSYPDHEGPTTAIQADTSPDPARAAAEQSLGVAELEMQLVRLRGENDGLRAKCARLAATVDELLARLARAAPRNQRGAAPVAGHRPVCPHCGSAELHHRFADHGWRCGQCGRLTRWPLARRSGSVAPSRTGPPPEPTCPHCGSADLRRWPPGGGGAPYCHSCGEPLVRPTCVEREVTSGHRAGAEP